MKLKINDYKNMVNRLLISLNRHKVIDVNKNKTNVSEIHSFLGENTKSRIVNPREVIENFNSIKGARKLDVSFCSSTDDRGKNLVAKSKASLVICHKSLLNQIPKIKSNLIFVDNSRYDFIRSVMNFFYIKPILSGIHPIAIVETNKIKKNVYLGPYVQIGKNASIGDDYVIFVNVVIYENVKIEKNVIIDSNTVIGTDGFGFERAKSKKLLKFPHFGNVKIGNYVKIGSNVSIDRGTIDDTIVNHGSKIDNLVHIAHNVNIGKNCLIIANSLIASSCILEDNVHVTMSATIRESVKLGKNSVVSMWSVVTKDVPKNVTVFENPARIFRKEL